MDELENKSDEELEKIVLAGVNLLPHIPQSESNRAKRILEYRSRKGTIQPMKKSERKLKLVEELKKYSSNFDVKLLYEDPEHIFSKNWLAEVSAIFKHLDETDYKKFMDFRQHLHDSIPLETRKHATEQLDSFIREKVADYKRYDFSYLDEDKPIEQQITEIRIFLSYSSKNKVDAGKIKAWLSDFGFKVFLAHEDIEASLEWQEVIAQNLKDCHVFIPIITSEFNQSDWTDQESGMAFITNKQIIPLSAGNNLNPHGFLARYQALPINTTNLLEGCIKIVKAVKNDTRYTAFLFELLLKSLKSSGSFASANWKIAIISEYKSWTKDQFDSLLHSAIENKQVFFASELREHLPKLIQNYKQLVDPLLLQQLNTADPDFNFA